MEKQCFKCLESKPLGEFYKHPQMKDGYLNKCKSCAKSDSNQHRQNNLEQYRSYDKTRATFASRKARAKAVTENWKKHHPKRRAANVLVGNAVRDGRLQKQPCWVCGCKAVAHHPDYDRPLDVVWLCQAHHKQAHAVTQ